MIDKLHFWCNKIIPLVYDEALSYYETVCKLVYAINETIKNVRELNDNAVFSVNEITPDENGNVDVGTVKSINGSTPDANGNVNLPTVSGVTSVDGIGADAQGNVQLNAVKSVNGETPNAQGAVTLSADDVGALPDTYTPPVISVNGETGAVSLSASDVGAMPDNYTPPVSSVNNKTGAVTLNANDVGALSNVETYGPLTLLSEYLEVESSINSWIKVGRVAEIEIKATATTQFPTYFTILSGAPTPRVDFEFIGIVNNTDLEICKMTTTGQIYILSRPLEIDDTIYLYTTYLTAN